jgi:hypothetical protein
MFAMRRTSVVWRVSWSRRKTQVHLHTHLTHPFSSHSRLTGTVPVLPDPNGLLLLGSPGRAVKSALDPIGRYALSLDVVVPTSVYLGVLEDETGERRDEVNPPPPPPPIPSDWFPVLLSLLCLFSSD